MLGPILIIITITTTLFPWNSLVNAKLPEEWKRIDCQFTYDQGYLSKSSCQEHGCLYDDTSFLGPACFLDPDSTGYRLAATRSELLPSGHRYRLSLKETSKNVTNEELVPRLNLTILQLSENIVRIRVEPEVHKQPEMPVKLHLNGGSFLPNMTEYQISLVEDGTLVLLRTSTRTKLLDTSLGGFLFTPSWSQVAFHLGSQDIYGLGPSGHTTFRHDLTYLQHSILSSPTSLTEAGSESGSDKPLPGAHPFYLAIEPETGNAHGVLFWDAHPMAYRTIPAPGLVWQTSGQVIDLLVMVGQSPEHVIQLYTGLVGRPAMPPMWALGFHLGDLERSNGVDEIRNVVEDNLNKTRVPLDGYHAGFTWDALLYAKSTELPKLSNLTHELSPYGLHWTITLRPTVGTDSSPYFYTGYERDFFAEWADSDHQKSIALKSRPGRNEGRPTAIYLGLHKDRLQLYTMIDFLQNYTGPYWTEYFEIIANKTGAIFDGCSLEGNMLVHSNPNCAPSKYTPHLCTPIEWEFMCPEVPLGPVHRHVQVHNIYGSLSAKATYDSIRNITRKRPFILSESTFPGSGNYTGHLTRWNPSVGSKALKGAIIALLQYSIFGIPATGSNICGYSNNVFTAATCRRWYQLGAYFPLSHALRGSLPESNDPFSWSQRDKPEVLKAAEVALRMRYRLLHYLYTLFHKAHTSGTTVARPMGHEFPRDPIARRVDTQFMLGHSILVAPFLDEEHEIKTTLEAYAPNSTLWYRLTSGNFVTLVPDSNRTKATNRIELFEHDSSRPLLFRGGSIIPIVTEKNLPNRLNSSILVRLPLELWVLPDSSGRAQGDLYLDDGGLTTSDSNFSYFNFEFENNTLAIRKENNGYNGSVRIDSIRIAHVLFDSFKYVLENGKWKVVRNEPEDHLHLNGSCVPLDEIGRYYTLHLVGKPEVRNSTLRNRKQKELSFKAGSLIKSSRATTTGSWAKISTITLYALIALLVVLIAILLLVFLAFKLGIPVAGRRRHFQANFRLNHVLFNRYAEQQHNRQGDKFNLIDPEQQ